VILAALEAKWHTRPIAKKAQVTPVDVKPFIPMTMKMNQSMGGGGGGGAHEIVEASKATCQDGQDADHTSADHSQRQSKARD